MKETTLYYYASYEEYTGQLQSFTALFKSIDDLNRYCKDNDENMEGYVLEEQTLIEFI